jgi:GH3 auxin-responsive promoter
VTCDLRFSLLEPVEESSVIPTVANSLWLSACLPEYLRFRRAIRRVAREQASVLQRIVLANADTEFGRTHGFRSIRSASEYQRQVPLRNYEGHQEWIARLAAGESSVLTSEPVRLFEPTGGSTGASKLIPYTASLQHQFRRGIEPWIADLFLAHPQLLSGRAYWSVSPMGRQSRYTQGGVPIGFEEDAAYLAGWQQRLVNSAMAVPRAVGLAQDIDTARYLTLLFLARCRDLKLISVWNPTFLSLLMEQLPGWGEEIARDIESGTVSRGYADTPCLPRLPGDRERARELRDALRYNHPAEQHARLWPGLRLISCWTDANASAPAAYLRTLFPKSEIQGKGLLATEGIISFPLSDCDAPALAVRSHFFEFLPIEATGETGPAQMAHELAMGRQYAVVITTGGGLYRYQMGDLVEVTGYLQECPLFRFLGRHDQVSDWFGEKLNEVYVARVFRDAFAQHAVEPLFAMLACDTRYCPAYILYIETAAPDHVLQRVGWAIEEALCRNFHYEYARQLRQLGPVRVFRAENAAASYVAHEISDGRRAGAVKPAALDRRNVWSDVFRGCFVPPRSETGQNRNWQDVTPKPGLGFSC